MANKPSEQDIYYTCKKCSRRLFDRGQVLHDGTIEDSGDNIGVSKVKASWGQTNTNYNLGIGGKCSSVFTSEAPEWVTSTATNQGRFACPNCDARVGSFAWSGATCSCGKWITPAFQFQLSRIDPKGLIPVQHSISARQVVEANKSNTDSTNRPTKVNSNVIKSDDQYDSFS